MRAGPKVEGWKRWRPGGFPGAGSSGDMSSTSSTSVGPLVEIFVNEAWTDISPDVRYADKIRTTGGRPDESARVQQNTCTFTLNNRGGKYSPRNPTSPLYGKIGRNTPVRVSVDQEGTQRFRFHGEIVAWPQNWDLTGNDVWVTISAAGVLRRLSQGNQPLHSTMYRGLARETDNPVIAYWTMEDGDDSTFFASAVSGVPNAKISGTPDLASFTDFDSSEPIPTMAGGSIIAKIPPYTVSGETQVRFLLAIPAAGETNGKRICWISTTGTAKKWELYYDNPTGLLGLRAYDEDGAILQDSGALGSLTSLPGQLTRVSVELTQSGANVSAQVSVVYLGLYLANDPTTFTGMTVGRVTQLSLNPGQGAGLTAYGHLSLQIQTSSSFDLYNQSIAYLGESPTTRIGRLCREEGISFVSLTNGQTGNTAGVMGPQGLKTLVDLLQECVDTDMGVLYEPRDRLGLEYRSRLSLYNRDPVMTLSYENSDLFEVPIPVDDDQLSRNDVTVKRDQGSSARAVLESGPLSILPPPDGIGTYDDAPTLSLEADEQLLDQASWRVHVGTVDEPRYPTITVHLKRSNFTASYDLTASALVLKPGDRYLVTDVPAWLPPGDISQIMNSYTEWFDQFEHVISFNGAPESPWRVATLDSATFGRADTSGSTLTTGITDVATSMSVTTTTGPVWVDSAGYASEFPFDISIGGEIMTVTAITGTTSPQTFTVTRAVNGIVKVQNTGADIRLAQPMIVAL